MNEEKADNFSPRTQQAFALARKEAERLRHNHIGSEHLLLGIIRLGEGEAVNVLQRIGLDLDTVRLKVETVAGIGPENRQAVMNIPFTPRVKKIISRASKEARALNRAYVSTEHILLGVLRENDGIAANVLRDLGVNIDDVLRAMLRESYQDDGPADTTRTMPDQRTSEDRGEQIATTQELGDQFLARMIGIVSRSEQKDAPFITKDQVALFFCLNLLLAGGYTFSGMTLEVVLALNAYATTTKRLNTVCQVVHRCWTGDKYTSVVANIQELYDSVIPDSPAETLLGSLLQKLTGKFPRKIGPERNMMEVRKFASDEEVGDNILGASAQIPETPPPTPPTN